MEHNVADILKKDEAVAFIAERHHLSASELVGRLLSGECLAELLDNEVEILRGLRRQLEQTLNNTEICRV